MKNSSPARALAQEINKIEEAVAAYLTPSITYVGKEDALFSSLKGSFFWIGQSDRYKSGLTSEAYIFNGKELTADIVNSLPRDSIVIVVHDAPIDYDIQLTDALRPILSVTLPNPSIEEISENLKILMVMREARYLLSEKCPIISVDAGYRKTVSQLVSAVTEYKNTSVVVDDALHGESLIEFLFRGLPAELSPVRLEKDNIKIRSDNHYHILTDPTKKSLLQIEEKIKRTKKEIPVLIVSQKHGFENPFNNGSFVSLAFPPLNERGDDLFLLSILASQRASHYEKHISYLTEKQVKDLAMASKTESRYLEDAESFIFEGNGSYDSEGVRRIIDKYNRLSLDDVMATIEHRVLERLYQQFGSVDSVVNAAGMPRVTYFKKRQRYKQSRRFIDLK